MVSARSHCDNAWKGRGEGRASSIGRRTLGPAPDQWFATSPAVIGARRHAWRPYAHECYRGALRILVSRRSRRKRVHSVWNAQRHNHGLVSTQALTVRPTRRA